MTSTMALVPTSQIVFRQYGRFSGEIPKCAWGHGLEQFFPGEVETYFRGNTTATTITVAKVDKWVDRKSTTQTRVLQVGHAEKKSPFKLFNSRTEQRRDEMSTPVLSGKSNPPSLP